MNFFLYFWQWSLFQEEVAREFRIPVPCQRFWLWARRQNYTYRLNRPLTSSEETRLVSSSPKFQRRVPKLYTYVCLYCIYLNLNHVFLFLIFFFYFLILLNIPGTSEASLSNHNTVSCLYLLQVHGSSGCSLIFICSQLYLCGGRFWITVSYLLCLTN